MIVRACGARRGEGMRGGVEEGGSRIWRISPDPVPHSGIGNAPCPLKWEQQNHRESGLVSREVIREHKEGAPPSCQALLPYVWRLQTTMSGRNSRVVVQMCCRTPQPLTEFKLAPNFLKPKTFKPSVHLLSSLSPPGSFFTQTPSALTRLTRILPCIFSAPAQNLRYTCPEFANCPTPAVSAPACPPGHR